MDPDSTEAHACTIAEVEVDTETGSVEVLSIRSAYEVGRQVNPELVQGQIVGGAWMGVSHALYETTAPYYPSMDHMPQGLQRVPDARPAGGARGRERRARDALVERAVRGQGRRRDDRELADPGHRQRHLPGDRRPVRQLPITPEMVLRGLDAKPGRSPNEAPDAGSRPITPDTEVPMGQITTWDEFPTVEYVPGVFRQAVSGEKTMLTRIVYRDGVVVPDHSHPAEQLMLVVQGRLWAKVGEEESEVGPGSLLIIPSDWVHAFRQLGDEDVVFYECFAPIRLEYLVGFKGPIRRCAMMQAGSAG